MRPMLHSFGNRENPILLLLHGIGAGHRVWRRQIDRFQSTHFVVTPDLPALTGPATNAPADIVQIAIGLERALRERSIETFSVCGISAGASIALALAPRMGGGVRHLILSAPQARAPRVMLGLQIAICHAMPERMLLPTAARMYRHDREIADAARRDCEALGKPGLLKAMRALWRLDLRGALPAIIAPTWVFCGLPGSREHSGGAGDRSGNSRRKAPDRARRRPSLEHRRGRPLQRCCGCSAGYRVGLFSGSFPRLEKDWRICPSPFCLAAL